MQLYVIAAAVDRDSVVKERGGGDSGTSRKCTHLLRRAFTFSQYLEDVKTGDTHAE